MRLALTSEQAAQLKTIMDRANVPLSPDVMLAQLYRLDWSQGAAIVFDIKIIKRAHAAKLAAYLVKLESKPPAKQKATSP